MLEQYICFSQHCRNTYDEISPVVSMVIGLIIATIVASIVAILYGKLLDFATLSMMFLANNYALAFILAAPCLFAISWAIVRYISPAAAGSGIPQLLTYILVAEQGTPVNSSLWVNCKLIMMKIISSTISTLGGGIVGREGPTIRISSVIFEMFEGFFKKYLSACPSREQLLAVGGGVGIAAGLNAPLAGLVFVIEGMCRKSSSSFQWMILLGVITAGCIIFEILGPDTDFGAPVVGALTIKNMSVALVAALIIGGIGSALGEVLYQTTIWTQKKAPKSRLMLALLIGLVMSTVCVLLGTNASGDGNILVRQILSDPSNGATQVSWLLAVWRTVGIALTYMTGCACGIFATSLSAGAALGALFVNTFMCDNQNLIIIVSMVAFLTGVIRAPITCFIVVFEMTDRQVPLLPMMAAAMVANMAATLLAKKSFYSESKDLILADLKLSATLSK